MVFTVVSLHKRFMGRREELLFLSATRVNVREQRQTIKGGKLERRDDVGLMFHCEGSGSRILCACSYAQTRKNRRESNSACSICMCKQRKDYVS